MDRDARSIVPMSVTIGLTDTAVVAGIAVLIGRPFGLATLLGTFCGITLVIMFGMSLVYVAGRADDASEAAYARLIGH